MEKWFGREIGAWYLLNKRPLPWREERDPYLIWLSEVILQQTQVAQGLAYYHRFKKAFPTVNRLARASEDEVLKLWQGLGYYSRARNLHAAAKAIKQQYRGRFPQTYAEIRALKGVGDYTAAAIASFAFGLPHAVVDGNVYRVLSRVFDLEWPIDASRSKKEFATLAASLLDQKDPGQHNQAIMEFGALHCRPVNPDCDNCVLRKHCQAYKAGTVSQRPVKEKKTRVRDRFFNYVVVADSKGDVLISKRGEKDIWQGLYEFSLIETSRETDTGKLLLSNDFKRICSTKVVVKHISQPYRHILTHQRLFARFCVVKTRGTFGRGQPKASVDNLETLAFPRLIEKFLNDCDLKEIL